MTDSPATPKPERPALPRDAFRTQRASLTRAEPAPVQPVVVTPAYDDAISPPVLRSPGPVASQPELVKTLSPPKVRPRRDRNPFGGYGERSSSRPYALRFPDPIDLVLRQMAAEERTHPLRIIDRIFHDHLKRIGRLPPAPDA